MFLLVYSIWRHYPYNLRLYPGCHVLKGLGHWCCIWSMIPGLSQSLTNREFINGYPHQTASHRDATPWNRKSSLYSSLVEIEKERCITVYVHLQLVISVGRSGDDGNSCDSPIVDFWFPGTHCELQSCNSNQRAKGDVGLPLALHSHHRQLVSRNCLRRGNDKLIYKGIFFLWI